MNLWKQQILYRIRMQKHHPTAGNNAYRQDIVSVHREVFGTNSAADFYVL